MKKYVSVFELFTRNTFYKILLIIGGMAGIECFWFRQKMIEITPYAAWEAGLMPAEEYSLEWLIDRSNGYGWFCIGFTLVTAVLCWNICNFGSNSSYTLWRMRITEKRILFMQMIYNGLCYTLFLAAQTGIFLMQYHMYCGYIKNVTNQTLFLAFYRNAFMHSILPLEDSFRWIANMLIISSCSVGAALFSYIQRRGKTAWSVLVMLACILLGFEKELGDQTILITALVVFTIAGTTFYRHVFQKKDES